MNPHWLELGFVSTQPFYCMNNSVHKGAVFTVHRTLIAFKLIQSESIFWEVFYLGSKVPCRLTFIK